MLQERVYICFKAQFNTPKEEDGIKELVIFSNFKLTDKTWNDKRPHDQKSSHTITESFMHCGFLFIAYLMTFA